MLHGPCRIFETYVGIFGDHLRANKQAGTTIQFGCSDIKIKKNMEKAEISA
jgi:hypothetical protein